MIWVILYLYVMGWMLSAIAVLAAIEVHKVENLNTRSQFMVAIIVGCTWPLTVPFLILFMVKS